MPTVFAGQSIPLQLAVGQSIVVKDLSGVSSVSGGSAREDASVRIGAGFFVYGPQASAVTATLSTTGLSEYQIVNGDPTPANAQVLFDPGNPPTTGPTLSGASAGAVRSGANTLKGRRLLTKMPFGRMKTVAMAADHTSHAQFTLECPADGLRVILFNNTGVDLVNVRACVGVGQQAGSAASATTPNVLGNPIALTLNGASTFTLPGAAGKTVATALDFVGSLSVDRTDRPEGLPLHLLRVEIPLTGNANRPAWYEDSLTSGHATENLTSAPYGRILRFRKADGLFATPATVGGFSGSTFAGDIVPFAVQYVPRMRNGRTLLVGGNSVDEGAGATVFNFGWPHELQALISTQAAPVEICNAAEGGSNSAAALTQIERLIALVSPTAVFAPSYNVNDISTTITAALISNMRYYAGRVRSLCEANGAQYLTSTGIPTNYVVKPFGATDALRLAYNTETLNYTGAQCIDFATAMRGPVDGNGQETMLVTADNIHPPTAGYRDYMAPTARTAVKAALALA